MNQDNKGGVRCHDADACAMGQKACPMPGVCGCAAPVAKEVLGSTCMDGGTCHHKDICTERCFRRECCQPLTLALNAGLTMEQWRYPAASVVQDTAAARAAEYDRWIQFHADGRGDYEDFLCAEHAGVAAPMRPSKAAMLAHYSQQLAQAEREQAAPAAVPFLPLPPGVTTHMMIGDLFDGKQMHGYALRYAEACGVKMQPAQAAQGGAL